MVEMKERLRVRDSAYHPQPRRRRRDLRPRRRMWRQDPEWPVRSCFTIRCTLPRDSGSLPGWTGEGRPPDDILGRCDILAARSAASSPRAARTGPSRVGIEPALVDDPGHCVRCHRPTHLRRCPARRQLILTCKTCTSGPRSWAGSCSDAREAVDGVSLMLARGRNARLVGESGCGKTTVGRAIVNILRAMSYRVEIPDASCTTVARAQSTSRRSRVARCARIAPTSR